MLFLLPPLKFDLQSLNKCSLQFVFLTSWHFYLFIFLAEINLKDLEREKTKV